MGDWAILLMMIVCGACAIAARGLWRLGRGGYWAAVVILTMNLLGDTGNALVLHDWRTLIGLPIGGFMLWYLIRKRDVFQN